MKITRKKDKKDFFLYLNKFINYLRKKKNKQTNQTEK